MSTGPAWLLGVVVAWNLVMGVWSWRSKRRAWRRVFDQRLLLGSRLRISHRGNDKLAIVDVTLAQLALAARLSGGRSVDPIFHHGPLQLEVREPTLEQ